MQGGEAWPGSMKTLVGREVGESTRAFARASAIIHSNQDHAAFPSVTYTSPDEIFEDWGKRITLHGDKAGDEYALYLELKTAHDWDMDMDYDESEPVDKAVVTLVTTAEGWGQQAAAVAKAREALGEEDVKLLLGSRALARWAGDAVNAVPQPCRAPPHSSQCVHQ